MKRRLRVAVWLLMVFALGGFLVLVSGIVPIKASSGHWSITRSLLQFGKRRSIATQSLLLDAPALEKPWLVLKGAGHYETGCRPCHGSPDHPYPRVARAMLPPPPYLPPLIEARKPEQLFYAVKHGIKFTGMPAWPSQQRDDEVAAIVAFLLAMPKLDATQYEQLVQGEAVPSGSVEPLPDLVQPEQPPHLVTANCARCHGVDGRGRGLAAFPKLAGQRREYLLAALQAFAEDERHSGIMQPIAAGLSAEERRELADYYSRLPIGAPDEKASAAAIERGRQIAIHGIVSQRVPSCKHCHGPDGSRKKEAYPVLAGQYADYLVLQLELFKQRRRGGAAYQNLMERVALGLEREQMRDVAQYYASLAPADEHERVRTSR